MRIRQSPSQRSVFAGLQPPLSLSVRFPNSLSPNQNTSEPNTRELRTLKFKTLAPEGSGATWSSRFSLSVPPTPAQCSILAMDFGDSLDASGLQVWILSFLGFGFGDQQVSGFRGLYTPTPTSRSPWLQVDCLLHGLGDVGCRHGFADAGSCRHCSRYGSSGGSPTKAETCTVWSRRMPACMFALDVQGTCLCGWPHGYCQQSSWQLRSSPAPYQCHTAVETTATATPSSFMVSVVVTTTHCLLFFINVITVLSLSLGRSVSRNAMRG